MIPFRLLCCSLGFHRWRSAIHKRCDRTGVTLTERDQCYDCGAWKSQWSGAKAE